MKKTINIILTVFLAFGLFLFGCGKEGKQSNTESDQQAETEEKVEVEEITYDDETHKEISFGKLQFEYERYHIKHITKSADNATFYCKIDSDADVSWIKKYITIEIEPCSQLQIENREDVKEYFDSLMEYEEMEIYLEQEETGTKKIYMAKNDQMTCCLIYVDDECYLLKTDDDGIEDAMITGSVFKTLEYRYKTYKEECGNGFLVEIKEETFHEDSEEIFEENADVRSVQRLYRGDELLQQIIFLGKQGDNKELCLQIWDENGENFQVISCETDICSGKIIPELLDANMDGYLDIYLTIGERAQGNIHVIYLWNEEKQCYEKAECEEPLVNIAVHEGYLNDWIRNGNGYDYQKLVWNGNKLILESEEYIEPNE